MELLGGAGALTAVIVSAWIGTRLLVRQQGFSSPEFLLGASLFLGGALALPLSMAAASNVLGEDARIGLGIAGQVATFAMSVTHAGFVLVVFRPDALWARLLVAAIGGAYATLLAVQFGGNGPREYFVDGGGVLRFNILAMQAMYLWASMETLRYWTRMRRQLRLGLGDAAAARRMLLWGLANVGSVVSNGSMCIAAFGFGRNPMQSPLLLGWMGLLTLASSFCLWLAFLAPERNRAREAAQPTA